jgi:hypothetical protein
MYLRDSYRSDEFGKTLAGAPVGCVAINMEKGATQAFYSFSALNPVDRFERGVARRLALGGMVESPFTVHISRHATMHDISTAIMKDLSCNKKAPARARKAALLWLRWNGA